MWQRILSFFGLGVIQSEIDYSQEAQWKRDAAQYADYAREWNAGKLTNWHEQCDMVDARNKSNISHGLPLEAHPPAPIPLPEQADVWERYFRAGKPREMMPQLPDPEANEAEWLRKLRK